MAATSMAIAALASATGAAAVPDKPAVPGPPPATVCGRPVVGGATCFAVRRLDPAGDSPTDPTGYTPVDLRSAYGLPANGGAGATIAVVAAMDDPRAESDLAQYRRHFGLPSCTSDNGCFRKVDQRGGTGYPRADAGWAGEIAVDLDMVSATAPRAHIILVEADWASFSNLGTAVDEAVALGAGYIANGYGGAETATEAAELDPFYRHPGVTIVAASGNGGDGVQYPAASPYLTAVGGTSLNRVNNSRGWSETVWHNGSSTSASGCSAFEVKPAWQTDRGCSTRTVADVSAVADPATGVAVYQSYGNGATGWSVYGGSSVAASIITGVNAIAGQPVAATYPAAYPYAASGSLNDVTSGADGTCTPAYLCTAQVGFDGPTGLGTPHGLAAFSAGPHGELTGQVTDAATHTGLADATVSIGPYPTRTDASGHYDLRVPVGSYALTVAIYGYAIRASTGLVLSAGSTVTRNLALTPLARSTLSGVVTDGSGHGWPLYARITVDGVPGGAVYTDPGTGRYSLRLPQHNTYRLNVTAVYKGYTARSLPVVLGATNRTINIALPIDAHACTAAGYTAHNVGTTEGFDGNTVPAGWSVVNRTGDSGWQFTDSADPGNRTGGSGGYAIVDYGDDLSRHRIDTTLTLPPVDFTATKIPLLSFDTLVWSGQQTNSVELSVDGGTTWTVPWRIGNYDSVVGSHVDLFLDKAAGKAHVLVRFHYLSPLYGAVWELDNVFIGRHTCDPVPGGLVLGTTDDANTLAGVNGTTLAAVGAPAVSTTSVATPDDLNRGDGFYWLFAPTAGVRRFTVSRAPYATTTATATVTPDAATRVERPSQRRPHHGQPWRHHDDGGLGWDRPPDPHRHQHGRRTGDRPHRKPGWRLRPGNPTRCRGGHGVGVVGRLSDADPGQRGGLLRRQGLRRVRLGR